MYKIINTYNDHVNRIMMIYIHVMESVSESGRGSGSERNMSLACPRSLSLPIGVAALSVKKKKKRNGDLENCIIVNSETLKGRTKGRERRDDCF